jgi:outer membrane receptor for Fe3+-dicitrate
MQSKAEEEARQQQEKKQAEANGERKGDEKKEDKNYSAEWVDDEIKLLVKGLKIIPVGTRERFY